VGMDKQLYDNQRLQLKLRRVTRELSEVREANWILTNSIAELRDYNFSLSLHIDNLHYLLNNKK